MSRTPPGPAQRRTDWVKLRLRKSAAKRSGNGLIHERGFISPGDRAEIVQWLSTIHPLWEERFSENHPPPPGQQQRRLLRPVYWLGNWQFACLGYYHPPRGVQGRCVRAEPFPPVLARLAREIERMAHDRLDPADVPAGWHLNTCLVNFYGHRVEPDGRRVDTARVGEHKDFEPGPVGSLSLGERAMFQFVASTRPGERDAVEWQQWLEDGALQLFAGPRWKDRLFHRVQRVEGRDKRFALHVEGFETRRVNFTFRYVPDEHVVPFAELSAADADDVRGYVETLAEHSTFFSRALARGRERS